MAVLGCIYVGSSTAFNALVGCNVLLANISYSFPISLMLFGRRKHLKPTTFPLGSILGPIMNALALAWILFMVVFFNFPVTMPVEASNMSMKLRLPSLHDAELTVWASDYSCVIIGAVAIISGGFWIIKGHKTYKGPVCAFEHLVVVSSIGNSANRDFQKLDVGIDAAFHDQLAAAREERGKARQR